MLNYINETVKTVFIILFSLFPVCGLASISEMPYGFRRPSGTENWTFPAYDAVQDDMRYIWIGTRNGLLRYDGYSEVSYRYREGDTTSLCNDHVNALLYCPDAGKMVVGTDVGVSVYDFGKDSFFTVESCGYSQVKSLLRDGNDLWIGTADGLLKMDADELFGNPSASAEKIHGLPSDYVACCRRIGSDLWFGSYDWFYRMTPDGTIHKYKLPQMSYGHNNLVLDIASDIRNTGIIWLGTEHGLVRYNIDGGERDFFLENVPVKYFFRYGSESLWIGTDNGLFIKDRTDSFRRFRHEAGNGNSLPDNVVWSMMSDSGGNVFLCTDNGIVLAETFSDRSFVSVDSVCGSNEGQDVSTMEMDSRGNLWLGGMDGLVKVPSGGGRGVWYRSDSGALDKRLSHNKVRDLYDDGKGLWIVSDGGLDRLDGKTGRIRHFTIMEQKGKYSSNWMYALGEDSSGSMWIGTYGGLLKIADKNALLSSSEPYLADAVFNAVSSCPLSGNVVGDFAAAESFAASLSGGAVDYIDLATDQTKFVRLPGDVSAYTLCPDGQNVLIGTYKGIYRLFPDATVEHIEGFALPVESIDISEGKILAISDGSLYIHDREDGCWTFCPFGDKALFCALSAEKMNLSGKNKGKTVFLGTNDGFFIMDTDNISVSGTDFSPEITSLFMDNERIEVGKEYDGNVILSENIGNVSGIDLNYRQNSFTVAFSSFEFSGRSSRYAYRLEGLDDNWQLTSGNTASFINVPAGDYKFEVYRVYPDNTTEPVSDSLSVHISPVWYATKAAFVIYILLFAGALLWVYAYLRMKHQLQIEHIEREEALNMVKMKTEFFANVSHEFKTPLSIILGFATRMISSEADSMKSRELKAMQKSAEKMHMLINRMTDANGNNSGTLFIPSSVSLKDLAFEVFDSFQPAFEEKNISARFVSDDINYIFMLDKVQMESVFQNLLSNAVKFTPEGGSVLMSVSIADETSDMIYAEVKVEDSGCGIKEDELPYIFNQYYKAPSNQKYNVSGSGIGLNLTRQIVEMHKGRISVKSEYGKGTCFTLRLSTMKADSFVLDSGVEENYLSLHSLSKVWRHERKPIILLVEDNSDIRDFITASLGKDYVFRLAGEGAEALEILESDKIDLVITDITMPGMDGLAMSRRIRDSVRTAFLPIIILTGKNDIQTQLKSFEYADAFVTKPFDLKYLNSRIIQLLIKHEQYLDKIRQQQLVTPESDKEDQESPDAKFLREIVEIVNRHIDDPELSVSVLCDESHYGSKQIYRKVKELTGMGVVEFIRDIRLQKAAACLSQKHLTVSETMYMVGFTTASYFAKCFKAKYGVSPSDYLKNLSTSLTTSGSANTATRS